MLISNSAEFVEMVVELRKQLALKLKLGGRFGKLGFPYVCTGVAPIARHGFAVINLLSRCVVFLDPLPDALAEVVVGFAAGRVDLPDVQDEFVVSHCYVRAHVFPLSWLVISKVTCSASSSRRGRLVPRLIELTPP